jgi:hypothetical protein
MQVDQAHMLAKTSDTREPQKRSTAVLVWLLGTFLFLAVQNTVVAQSPLEVSVEVAEAPTSVKCAGHEHHLAIVKASMPNAGSGANASALGVALVPPKGDVKLFARYWFFFPGQALNKRDDDSGAAVGNLKEAGPTSKAYLDKFFESCSVEKEKPVITQVLDTAVSIDEAVATLSANGLQFKAVTNSKQNLAKPLTVSEESYVAFSAVTRAALQQRARYGASQIQSQGNSTVVPVVAVDQSEAIKENLKQLEGKIDSLASRNRLLLILLTTVLSLGVAVVTTAVVLFYLKQWGQPRSLIDPEVQKAITQLTIEELKKFQKADTKGDDDAKPGDNAETIALREFIGNHFGRKFLDPDIRKGLNNLTAELNQNLLPLAGNDSNGSSPTLDRLQSARQQVQMMWETYSRKPCPSGALTTLQKDWASLQNTFQPFKQDDFKEVLSYARESVELFQLLSEKFKDQSHNPTELKQDVEGLFKELKNTYTEFNTPEHTYSLSPRYQLDDLRYKLQGHNQTTQSVVNTIRTVLPNAAGPIDEMTTTLVNKFNSNKQLVSSAAALKTSNEQLTRELESLKLQTQGSTQLAGVLSHYVHLTAGAQLESPQVQAILQRFTAGNYTHRQLRLRLSAAIEALNRAVVAVGNAGRTNALDALRISEFKDRLDELLTNLESFDGDAIWKECLSSGLLGKWLHHLLRAELVARTYFAEDDSLALLIAPLTEACTALRATIRQFNVQVPLLTLLSEPPPGATLRYEIDPKLGQLLEFQQKVRAKWEQRKPGEDPKFIVDVEVFPWQADGNGNKGEVVAISGSMTSMPMNA